MTRYDPHELNAQYNNRALVPDFADYLARWSLLSEETRARSGVALDVAYGPAERETLDVFNAPGSGVATQGKAATKRPVVIYIHGGYWRSLSKREHSFVAQPFVDRQHCVVLPNYPLCPSVGVTDIALSLTRAVAWVYKHIATYGGDPDNIVLIGHSAGGHLAAMLTRCAWPVVDNALPRQTVKSALAISGLFDLEPLMHSPMLQADVRLTPEQVALASPVRFKRPSKRQAITPLSCVVGRDESDEFRRQNQLLKAHWGSSAVPVALEIPGCNHFSILDALVQPGSALNRLAMGLSQ